MKGSWQFLAGNRQGTGANLQAGTLCRDLYFAVAVLVSRASRFTMLARQWLLHGGHRLGCVLQHRQAVRIGWRQCPQQPHHQQPAAAG